jgi:site-specific DNA-methyltransferase (adenine-specific)
MLATASRCCRKSAWSTRVVTDPPYHLLQTSRGGSPRQNDLATPFGRTLSSGGFMGQRWDGGDIAFRPETWAAIAGALQPGGYLLAFGGTRTHHRLWSAIEDAGFVVQDTIMWLCGQGFPKGRTQLKPAFEPICVAYKPGAPRVLQVDDCRIAGMVNRAAGPPGFGSGRYVLGSGRGELAQGRWPANVCHDGSDEVMAAFAALGEHNAGTAARFFYCAKAGKADRAGSKHPTIKPVALTRWLVRLVTPPGGTVLDPFAGSGTTGAAALAEGRQAILIEREAEYIADIRRRLARSALAA